MKERLQVDLREIVYEEDLEAIAELERLQPAWFESEIRLAKLFARIDRKAAYIGIRAASIEELAARRGYDPPRAHELALLGHALAGIPDLERKLRDREIGFHAATVLGYVYRNPIFLEEGDDWLLLAQGPFRDLWRAIRRRLESVRQGGPANRTVRLDLTEDALEVVEEAQDLAIARVGEAISKGQLFYALAVFFLRALKPTWKPRRKRRMGPTSGLPFLRSVAREVRRAILQRSDGKCEFGQCRRVGEELCHLVRHAEGSGREVHDLVLACRIHHKFYDMGKIRFLAWTKDEDLPLFQDAMTGELLVPKPCPQKRETTPFPRWLQKIVGIVRRRPRKVAPLDSPETSEAVETPSSEAGGRAPAPGRAAEPPRREDAPVLAISPEEAAGEDRETGHEAARGADGADALHDGPRRDRRESRRPLPPGASVVRERGSLPLPRPDGRHRLRRGTYADAVEEPPSYHLLL